MDKHETRFICSCLSMTRRGWVDGSWISSYIWCLVSCLSMRAQGVFLCGVGCKGSWMSMEGCKIFFVIFGIPWITMKRSDFSSWIAIEWGRSGQSPKKCYRSPPEKAKQGRRERRERSDRSEQPLFGFFRWASV